MSIREREPSDFSSSLRGYDRGQVDKYLARMRESTTQVEERASAAESALAQCRRELASTPGTAGISQRLAAILELANEEAHEIRARAQADSETTTERAAGEAERTINDAHQRRDAIQREIDELSAVRDVMLERLIELGGKIRDATQRYQGYPPGATVPVRDDVKLFDAEAADDETAVDTEPVADPDADTQRNASTD